MRALEHLFFGCRIEFGDTADWKSALPLLGIARDYLGGADVPGQDDPIAFNVLPSLAVHGDAGGPFFARGAEANFEGFGRIALGAFDGGRDFAFAARVNHADGSEPSGGFFYATLATLF